MNNSATTADQEAIVQMVRGKKPWEELRRLGIELAFEDGSCRINNPRGIEATADAHDLAEGLLAFREDVQALRRWAFVIEAGSSFLDLRLEPQAAAEILLDAVWKASFGDPVPGIALRTAEELLQARSNQV